MSNEYGPHLVGASFKIRHDGVVWSKDLHHKEGIIVGLINSDDQGLILQFNEPFKLSDDVSDSDRELLCDKEGQSYWVLSLRNIKILALSKEGMEKLLRSNN